MYMHVYEVYLHACSCVCASVSPEARGELGVPSSVTICLIFSEAGSLTEPGADTVQLGHRFKHTSLWGNTAHPNLALWNKIIVIQGGLPWSYFKLKQGKDLVFKIYYSKKEEIPVVQTV